MAVANRDATFGRHHLLRLRPSYRLWQKRWEAGQKVKIREARQLEVDQARFGCRCLLPPCKDEWFADSIKPRTIFRFSSQGEQVFTRRYSYCSRFSKTLERLHLHRTSSCRSLWHQVVLPSHSRRCEVCLVSWFVGWAFHLVWNLLLDCCRIERKHPSLLTWNLFRALYLHLNTVLAVCLKSRPTAAFLSFGEQHGRSRRCRAYTACSLRRRLSACEDIPWLRGFVSFLAVGRNFSEGDIISF
jgi:hypothetical protein